MTTIDYLAWFIFMAVATFTILLLGTLVASDLLPRSRRRPADPERPARSHPPSQAERSEVPAGLHPSGRRLSTAPSNRALLDAESGRDRPAA